MLNRIELLFSIIGGWIISLILIFILKLRRGSELPKGSIVIKSTLKNDEKNSTPGYNLLLLIGMGSISFLNLVVIFLCIFDFWNIFASYLSIDFPKWVNWLGVIGIWVQDIWGGLVFAYNVNYTPAYKPMKENYVLATGGPYKFIRHPMYSIKAILVIFFFLATGIWFSLLGMISWIVLPSQAKREEEVLTRVFGEEYKTYLDNSGRFLPKIKFLKKDGF